MADEKVSPGPWRWRHIPGVPERIEVLSADGKYIGILWALDDGSPRDADGALIASAPTIAARLAEAVALLRRYAWAMTGALHTHDVLELPGKDCTACDTSAFLARIDAEKGAR